MANEHESGLPGAYDRSPGKPWQGLVHSEGRFIEAAELNEAQGIARRRGERIAQLVARDGNRVEGAAAVVLPDGEVGQVILTSGRIYVAGDILPVEALVLDDVPMVGVVEIGVRLVKTWITHEDDPTLLGMAPGALSEGEPGAAREVMTISWALADDGGEGNFVAVYLMRDGTILDQTPPPELEGINQAIAIYDRDAHGHYIVSGSRVTALGKTGDAQVFSIEEGVCNIQGFKRTRLAALRHVQEEDWDVEVVSAEVTSWPVGENPAIFATAHAPIDEVTSVLVTKQATETITRGSVAGGADLLPHNGVTTILEVVQGETSFDETTDWVRSGNSIDWSPGGAEPATSSSYSVTYRYLALVEPDDVTDTTIEVSGGVDETTVILAYTWKMPRIDLLCLNQGGDSVYVEGVSARQHPLPPIPPADVLPLAEIHNTWVGKPTVVNNGVRAITFAQAWRVHRRVQAHERLLELERIKNAIDQREQVAKLGIFVDPFINDHYRDAGEEQTAAVWGGVLELAIEPTFYVAELDGPVTLDWTEEVIIRQERSTGCLPINPYQNFDPLPGSLTLTPSADFWTVQQTQWASPVTQEFNRGIRRDNGPLVVSSEAIENLGDAEEQIEFLRQIPIAFRITGFGASENLAVLTFDGVDVNPGALTADAEGVIEDEFVIPANVTAGTKVVYAEGAAGTSATALFVGQGIIQIDVMRRVTTIERWQREEVQPAPTPRPGPRVDPLAQTFRPSEDRMLVGADIKFCAIGDEDNAAFVELCSVENGIPTEDVRARVTFSMEGVEVGWFEARWSLPVVTHADNEHAYVIGTDDAEHALAIAKIGEVDPEAQVRIGSQPYTTGVLLSSSNKSTWTPHQLEDLAFRAVAALFGPLTKTVTLGSFDLVDCSDLQVRAAVELPSPDCRVVFEIVRPGGSIIRLLPFQVMQLTEYLTETVQLRAVLTGTEKLAPILYAPVILIAGRIEQEGTYVTRAFKLGTGVDLTAYYKANLPAGSTVALEYDLADDDWQELPFDSVEALTDPAWVENKHVETAITGVEGRLRITITGGPAARLRIGDLGASIT